MTDKSLSVDNKPHELKLGASFDPKSGVAYHSIRYDFKPASVDTTQEAQVDIGQGHHVTLTVPHVEGSGKAHTVYKGNKRPVSKECVLIIDHDTGMFTLERLTNNINVKKTRMEGSSKVPAAGRPLTPVDPRLKSSPGKTKSSQSPCVQQKAPSPPPPPPAKAANESLVGEISDSSSGSDLSSDSDSDAENDTIDTGRPPVPMTATQPTVPQQTTKSSDISMSMISADLQLSDSDSDSD
ncbi:ELL-associated factor 1-like isoform X2 [Mercenaria mercenaria]|uniref:ELL-associated factor 1-like isoform X1 n=1 Tax=Mercenaria mercenaria TaxID=6596 RepID=UPI00234E51CF|nr:ELL-associated factor 1-like isoform X1 [Mercenaria mercenaria]XP_053373051.1 ELL-associated factor 1-like isoform X2 [Mercenaria mercenaria]